MSKRIYILGFFLIAGFAVLMASEMQRAATPYVSKVENVTESNGPVQFKGSIIHDKIAYERSTHLLRFTLNDNSGKSLPVIYGGPKPGNFDTANVAVVCGVYSDGEFKANKLLLKCPSKYQDQR